MGTAELDSSKKELILHSHIIIYGNAADRQITTYIGEEIETMWNEPKGSVQIDDIDFSLVFKITSQYNPNLQPEEIFENTDPANNYFRIEEYAAGNISFVDGLGCNTGYFKKDNLYTGSTTAAHEYGHTLGLKHPHDLDLRGKGTPGIMYPRGTIVDSQFQYNPGAMAGDSNNGGTMHPMHRRVLNEDIRLLKLHRLIFKNSRAIVGEFSSIWHPDHSAVAGNDPFS